MRRAMFPLQRALSVLFLSTVCLAATVSDYDTLYSNLFSNYNRKLLPVVNVSDVAYIALDAELVSLNEFNGITGELSVTVVFSVSWTEERMGWTPADYNNATSMLVSPEDMWRPQIFIRESADHVIDICNTSLMMRLMYDGTILWTPGNIVKIACSIDVTYFPFDKQSCNITLSSFAYTTESLIYTVSEALGTSYYLTNSQWELDQSSSITNVTAANANAVTLTLILQRRSRFFVVYIVVPIISLGMLNTLVFVMPAMSGERTSVAITTLLSFVVYMQLINDVVPENSEPMASLYYYLLFLMVYSSTTMLLCIVSLRIYDKRDRVPVKVRQITWCLTLRWLRKKKSGTVHPRLGSESGDTVSEHAEGETDVSEKDDIKVKNEDQTLHPTKMDDITWSIVGKTFDRYCYVILNILFVCISAFVFAKLYDNSL